MDRAKLVAYLIESSSVCQSCGTAEWEWEEDRYAYEAIVVRCHGCAVKDASADEAKDKPGARISLMPTRQARELASKPSRRPSRRG
jgi:hypothetical protein